MWRPRGREYATLTDSNGWPTSVAQTPPTDPDTTDRQIGGSPEALPEPAIVFACGRDCPGGCAGSWGRIRFRALQGQVLIAYPPPSGCMCVFVCVWGGGLLWGTRARGGGESGGGRGRMYF